MQEPEVAARPDEEYKLDGKVNALADTIRKWETESAASRDQTLDRLFGERLQQSKYRGMRGVVYNAMLAYLPRAWELPPYKRANLGTDENRLAFPWFFGNIQQIIPIASPPGIKIRALPQRSSAKQFSAFANALLDEECEYLDMDTHNQGLVCGAKLFGSQVGWYAPRAKSGPLAIDRIAELCDPLAFLWEPGATSIADSKYLIYKRWPLISEVKRVYNLDYEPEACEIEAEKSSLMLYAEQSKCSFPHRCCETIIFVRDSEETEEIVYQTVQQDHEIDTDEGPLLGDDDQPITIPIDVSVPVPVSVQKYPHGRLIVMVNDRIVKDEAYDEPHHDCPFVKLDNYSFPFYFWGLPEWLIQGDMPHVVNEAMSALIIGARTSFSKMVVDEDALKTKVADITNDPADPILLDSGRKPGTGIDVIKLGGLGPEYAMALRDTLTISDKITGVTDPLRGQVNSNVTSGVQQRELTQNATARQTPFVERLIKHLEKAGKIIFSNAVQYRQPDDMIEFMENSGQQTLSLRIADFPRDLEFKIKIIPQSALPTDRQERMKVLLDMIPKILAVYQQSPELADAIVTLTDIPEIEEAWERVKVSLAANQQAMALLQGAEGAQPMPGQ